MSELIFRWRFREYAFVKLFSKIAAISLVFLILSKITWFNLSVETQQHLAKFAANAGLWIQKNQILEKSHFVVFYGMKYCLIWLFVNVFCCLIAFILVKIELMLLEYFKKEENCKLPFMISTLTCALSMVIACFIMTKEIPRKVVDEILILMFKSF